MQVNLTIDANQLGETVIDVFKSLSAEQRQDIAKTVIREWLMQPNEHEFRTDDGAALVAARNVQYYRRDISDAELRKTEEYRKAVANTPNPKLQMIQFIRDEAVAQFKASVNEMVSTDPQIQVMKDAVCEVVRDMFPAVVHDAMVLWVAANLDKAVSAACNGVMFRQMGNSDGTGTISAPTLQTEIGNRIKAAITTAGIPIPE